MAGATAAWSIFEAQLYVHWNKVHKCLQGRHVSSYEQAATQLVRIKIKGIPARRWVEKGGKVDSLCKS